MTKIPIDLADVFAADEYVEFEAFSKSRHYKDSLFYGGIGDDYWEESGTSIMNKSEKDPVYANLQYFLDLGFSEEIRPKNCDEFCRWTKKAREHFDNVTDAYVQDCLARVARLSKKDKIENLKEQAALCLCNYCGRKIRKAIAEIRKS